MKRPGFFMTEFLLYVGLSALLCVFLLRYLFDTTLQLRSHTLQADYCTSVHAALDAVRNDLEKAPGSVKGWQMLETHELAWQNAHQKIRWRLQDGKLKRTIQRYDAKKEQWRRPVTHVLLDQVSELHFAAHQQHNQLAGISCVIVARLPAGKLYRCQSTISLYNRVLS